MSTTHRIRLAALAAATTLVVAACGSGSDSGSDGAASGSAASGPTLTIGALAPSLGASAYPEVEAGLKAAEHYINTTRGGVDGRQLAIDICQSDGTPETAVACANKFVEAKHPVVIDPYDPSFPGARAVLVQAGIPFAGTVSADPTNEAVDYGQGFYWTGPLAVTAAGAATLWESTGAKTVSFASRDFPAAHTYVDNVLQPLADSLGVQLRVQYVDENTANWNAVAAALLEGSPDLTGTVTNSEDGCTSLFGALRKQGWTKNIFVGSCTKYVTELSPEEAAGTITVPRTWLPQAKDNAPAEQKKQLEDFAAAMEAVGETDLDGARAIYAFTSAVTLAQALSEVSGDVTPQSATQAIESIKDLSMFLGPKVTCDGAQWPGVATACSNQSIWFTVQEDGSYKPGDAAGFVDVSPTVIDALS